MYKYLSFLPLFGCFWMAMFSPGNLPKVDACPVSQRDSSHFQCVITVEPPLFPPGNLQEWIKRHLFYPIEAFEENREGKVYTLFNIDTAGQIGDVRVMRSSDTIFNEEAIRVIRKMPAWFPCKDKGKPVEISYALPVTFRLDEAILFFADEMPVFPEERLDLWLKKEVRKCYASSSVEHSVRGKCFVGFIIEKDGRVIDPEILRSSGFSDLDAEALKIVRRMPRWKPGRHRDKPVRISYLIPVYFN